MISKCVETNFKIIANNRVNVELLLLLNRLRTLIHKKDKAVITLNVDNTDGDLSFEFTANNNEIDPIKLENEFNIR